MLKTQSKMRTWVVKTGSALAVIKDWMVTEAR